VQDIAAEGLHIRDLKLGLAVDRDHAGVILLTTSFGVKVGFVKEQAEGTRGELRG
jgi:hypothetical protein